MWRYLRIVLEGARMAFRPAPPRSDRYRMDEATYAELIRRFDEMDRRERR